MACMQAYAYLEKMAEIFFKVLLIEYDQFIENGKPRPGGIVDCCFDIFRKTKNSIEPIACCFNDAACMAFISFSDQANQTSHDMDDIKGQVIFNKGRKVFDIEKEQGKLFFFTNVLKVRLCILVYVQMDVCFIPDDAVHMNGRALHIALAGQAHMGRKEQNLLQCFFRFGWRGDVVKTFYNQYAAGGALGIAATGMVVRNAGGKRSLQYGLAFLYLDGAVANEFYPI
jgi:hypothetical protein